MVVRSGWTGRVRPGLPGLGRRGGSCSSGEPLVAAAGGCRCNQVETAAALRRYLPPRHTSNPFRPTVPRTAGKHTRQPGRAPRHHHSHPRVIASTIGLYNRIAGTLHFITGPPCPSLALIADSSFVRGCGLSVNRSKARIFRFKFGKSIGVKSFSRFLRLWVWVWLLAVNMFLCFTELQPLQMAVSSSLNLYKLSPQLTTDSPVCSLPVFTAARRPEPLLGTRSCDLLAL